MRAEKSIACPTCGTLNAVYENRCHTCQRPLLMPLSLSSTDKTAKSCSICGTKNSTSASHCIKCHSLSFNIDEPITHIHLSEPTWPAHQSHFFSRFISLKIIISIALLISTLIFTYYSFNKLIIPSPKPTISSLPNNLGTITVSGETIGINDGSFMPFDIGREDDVYKQNAARDLNVGNKAGALSEWEHALALVSNDAEVLIYRENLQILQKPHITIIVGVSFSPPFPNQANLEILQGTYLAQHTFNENHTLKARVLIANIGSSVQYVTEVAHQIVAIAGQQKIVGIIGWPNSSATKTAIQVLQTAKIPIISPSATSDDLTNISPYFFRIVPPNTVQATMIADYAIHTLHARRAVIFFDATDPYSQTLSNDFIYQFQQKGGTVVYKAQFLSGKTTDFTPLIQQALSYNPDVLYFTSALTSDAALFGNEYAASGQLANLPIIAGSSTSYALTARSYGHWYFPALAFHEAWNIAFDGKEPNAFFSDYIAAFDPNALYRSTYDYQIAPANAILAYDATNVLIQNLPPMKKNSTIVPTSLDAINALLSLSGTNVFQGVSGQITFGADHNPINKAILMLHVSPDGFTEVASISGCFIKGCP